jgi:hypothetical protein
MERLPQELINKIALCLERKPEEPQVPILLQQATRSSKLPPYATISSRWKEAVEFVTFHSLCINSDELSKFGAIMTSHRRRYLTNLSFTVVLPVYSEEACGRVELEEEQQLNNESYTMCIHDLFSTLKKWEIDGLQTQLQLKLEHPFSPTDLRLRNIGSSQIWLEIARGIRGKDILGQRWEQSFLKLSDPRNIPVLSNVHHFSIKGNSERQLAPTVGPNLAASLPDLRVISWEFGEPNDQTINIDNRVTFAQALTHAEFRYCSTANIFFYHEVVWDQRPTPQRRVPAAALHDPLSASLRVFSQNLTSLTFGGHFDSTLFWPSKDETGSTPTWPHLRKLKIGFNMVTPSGDWYFTGMPVSHEHDDPAHGIVGGDEDEDGRDSAYYNYREHGNARTLNPFLTAFAKAVQKMPVLEHFMLETELGYGKGFWEISYYAPGQVAEWENEEHGRNDNIQVRRVHYTVGEVWRPDDVITEGIRNVGREKFGDEVIERYLGPRLWRYND